MAAPAPAPAVAPLTLSSIGAGKYNVVKPTTVTAGSNNNPFNIKVGSETQQYIASGKASVGSTATDGGNFLKFNSRNDAVTAAQGLLFSSGVYKGLTVDAALKKWSNNGYGGTIVPSLANTPIDQLTPDQQTQVLNAMELKGENDTPAPGTLSLSQIGAGKYTVVGKGDTPPAQQAPVTQTPAWAPGGVPKPAAPVGPTGPFSQNKVADNQPAAEGLVKGVGNALTSAEQGLGKEAAAVIDAPAAAKNQENLDQSTETQLQLAIAMRNRQKASGLNTSKVDSLIAEMISGIGKGATEADVNSSANDSPANVLENAGGIVLDTLSGGTYKGALKTGELALKEAPTAVEAAGKGVEALAQRSERKAVAQIATDVSPKLTARETASAIAKQGTTKTGILRRTVLKASKQAQDIAATIKKMVPDFKPGGSLIENAQKTRDAAYASVKTLAAQVEKDGKNIAIPIREIASKIKGAVSTPAVRIALKDTQFEKQVDALAEEATNIMKGNGGTPSGILKSTQEFDDLVRQVYPNLYDKEFSAPRSAVKVIRDAMSNMVDDSLPDTAYKAIRQAQSRLFTAAENMEEKAASGAEKEIGKNAIDRFSEKHPIVSGLGKLLGAGVGAGVGLGGLEEGLKKLGI